MPVVFAQPSPISGSGAAQQWSHDMSGIAQLASIVAQNNRTQAELQGQFNTQDLRGRQESAQLAYRTQNAAAEEEMNRRNQGSEFESQLQSESIKQQNQAQLQAWVNSQDMTQKEQMRLKQLQSQVSDVNADPNLSPDEKSQMILQMKTGIDPLNEKLKNTKIKQQQEAYNQMVAKGRIMGSMTSADAQVRGQLFNSMATYHAPTDSWWIPNMKGGWDRIEQAKTQAQDTSFDWQKNLSQAEAEAETAYPVDKDVLGNDKNQSKRNTYKQQIMSRRQGEHVAAGGSMAASTKVASMTKTPLRPAPQPPGPPTQQQAQQPAQPPAFSTKPFSLDNPGDDPKAQAFVQGYNADRLRIQQMNIPDEAKQAGLQAAAQIASIVSKRGGIPTDPQEQQTFQQLQQVLSSTLRGGHPAPQPAAPPPQGPPQPMTAFGATVSPQAMAQYVGQQQAARQPYQPPVYSEQPADSVGRVRKQMDTIDALDVAGRLPEGQAKLAKKYHDDVIDLINKYHGHPPTGTKDRQKYDRMREFLRRLGGEQPNPGQAWRPVPVAPPRVQPAPAETPEPLQSSYENSEDDEAAT